MERRLFLAASALLIVWLYTKTSSLTEEIGIKEISLDSSSQTFELRRNGNVALSGNMGKNFDLTQPFTHAVCDITDGENLSCIKWETVKFIISDEKIQEPKTKCYTVYWESLIKSENNFPLDCFDFGQNHWYGGAELFKQRWAIDKQEEVMQQYLSWDNGFNDKGYSSVLERYWLSSNGVAIYVYDDSPLHFGITSSQLCFKSDYANSWYNNPNNSAPSLRYSICMASDVKAVHSYMANRFIAKPDGIPDEGMFRYPIWSTWARYKTGVTQEIVLQYAKEIKQNGFNGCQIEIDDIYTTTYGDHKFDLKKFPDAQNMIQELHKQGFKVTSWIHPFVNVEAEAFQEGVKKDYYVKDSKGVPSLVRWWQGIGGLLDVTNPHAVKWYFDRLSHLTSLGMDSFKFDAGESNFLPTGFQTYKPLPNANHYGRLYAEAAYQHAGKGIEVRVGYRSQHLPIFVRMMDKESHWDYERAFRTVIPNALQFGIIGYPFLLPDMIGGNGYDHNLDSVFITQGKIPPKELFIRWLELNVFLPSMQYSFAPWQYDNETVQTAKRLTTLHETYVTDLVLKLAQNALKTGEPIIRPLWWIDPLNTKTFDIEDEFLVGNDLLVAPVVEKDSRDRDIYLPAGEWKDKLRGQTYKGKQTLENYKVDLHEIAYFERLHDRQ